MKRRQFLKTSTAAGSLLIGAQFGLFDPFQLASSARASAFASPVLTPFVDPLPIPSVLRPVKRVNGLPFFEVPMTQFQQQLHRDLAPTTVWGYHGTYPGPTIEARRDKPILVKWINDLPTTHLLASSIDHTLAGAEPPTPDVRNVVHLHEGHVPPESDGGPLDWFTPGNFRIYRYPNIQPAATLWYHDHALAITRLNVYAGLAGFYILRDHHEDCLKLPRGPFEIPLVIQDRTFQANGQLFYPDQGVTPIHPVWVPEFFGDTALVNGKVFPFLEVEPRKYRFRILNGCNSRFLQIALSSGQTFLQIGAEGGFLPRPVRLAKILLGPAERADVIVDFSGHENQNIILTNDAPAPFPAGGEFVIPQIMQFRVKQHCSSKELDLNLEENLDPNTQFLPLAVGLETEPLHNKPPHHKPPHHKPPHHEPPIAKVRFLTLTEEVDAQDNPIRLLLDGLPFNAPATETPKLNTTEIWNLINLTGDTHPIHLHLVTFHVLDRQPFDVNVYNATKQLVFTGPPVPRAANEAGLKDTVRANPGEVTRFKVSFTDFTGNYVWHCHILEHEDNDMMRPLVVIP